MAWCLYSSLVTLLLCSLARSECPNGFVRNVNSCYLFSVLRVSWIQAMKFCEIYQSDLAVIETEDEQLFMEGYLNTTWRNANQTDGVWISGTDLLVDGEWMWAKSGEPIEYTKWAPGEPNSIHMNMGGEDCIDLIRHADFLWNDEPCEYKMNFVCERPLSSKDFNYVQ